MGILKVMCKRDVCTTSLVRSLPRFITFDIDEISTQISITQWIRYLYLSFFFQIVIKGKSYQRTCAKNIQID